MGLRSRLLLKDTFSSEQIDIVLAPSNRTTTPQFEQQIEDTWGRQLVKAQRRGDQLWDTEAYRLNNFSVQDGRLQLELATVAYRVHSALKELHSEPRISEKHADKLLVADALVRTNDGMYIVARVDKVSEQAVVLLGGSCTKGRLPKLNSKALFDFAVDRLATVLNVSKKSLEPPVLKGVILNEVGSAHLIFEVAASCSSEDLAQNFISNNGISELIFVKESDLPQFLASADGYIKETARLLTSR